MCAISTVRAPFSPAPPSESFNSRVSLESRKFTKVLRPPEVLSALITFGGRGGD